VREFIEKTGAHLWHASRRGEALWNTLVMSSTFKTLLRYMRGVQPKLYEGFGACATPWHE